MQIKQELIIVKYKTEIRFVYNKQSTAKAKL